MSRRVVGRVWCRVGRRMGCTGGRWGCLCCRCLTLGGGRVGGRPLQLAGMRGEGWLRGDEGTLEGGLRVRSLSESSMPQDGGPLVAADSDGWCPAEAGGDRGGAGATGARSGNGDTSIDRPAEGGPGGTRESAEAGGGTRARRTTEGVKGGRPWERGET